MCSLQGCSLPLPFYVSSTRKNNMSLFIPLPLSPAEYNNGSVPYPASTTSMDRIDCFPHCQQGYLCQGWISFIQTINRRSRSDVRFHKHFNQRRKDSVLCPN